MAFTFGGMRSMADERFERLERRIAMLETVILEQRNKRVWSEAAKDEPAKAPKTELPGLDSHVVCKSGCACVVKASPNAYRCDKCNKNYDGRRWRCETHDWDACPSCVGVPPPKLPEFTMPPTAFAFGAASSLFLPASPASLDWSDRRPNTASAAALGTPAVGKAEPALSLPPESTFQIVSNK